MDFSLTDEQRTLFDTVVAFARDHVAPGAAQRDHDAHFDPVLWRRLDEVGLLGLCVPQALGGSGADAVTTGIALEALQYGGGDAGLNLSLGAHLTIGCMPIVTHGTPAQQRRWLPRLVRGDSVGAFAITEPDVGSDTAAMRTRARREGDTWVLDGAKTFITNASLAEVVTVVARTDPSAPPGQAFTAFLVPTDRPGFAVSREIPKMGCRSSPTGEVVFDGVELSDDDILGEPGTALWKIAFDCFAWERTVMIASPIGGMRRDLDAAVGHARDRHAFGGPIGRFGQIQHRLTEMRMHLEAASLLQRQAAWRRDRGLDHEVEASLAKKYVGEYAVAGALDAIQVHGGWGYTTEFEVERGLRDAKLASLGGGTTEIQEMIVARRLLGR